MSSCRYKAIACAEMHQRYFPVGDRRRVAGGRDRHRTGAGPPAVAGEVDSFGQSVDRFLDRVAREVDPVLTPLGEEEFQDASVEVAQAQVRLVNAMRRSLGRGRKALTCRIGGALSGPASGGSSPTTRGGTPAAGYHASGDGGGRHEFVQGGAVAVPLLLHRLALSPYRRSGPVSHRQAETERGRGRSLVLAGRDARPSRRRPAAGDAEGVRFPDTGARR